MTPEQIDKVQASFAKVVPISDDAGRIFYGRLFNVAPEVRPLFQGDLDEQARKLMMMLGTVVNGLKNLDAIIPAAKALAVRHVAYGVEPAHYAPVGEALLWTLEQGLGDDFDAETRDAWTAAYTTLSGVMIEAASESTPSKEG